jgi:hypothetical protein
MSEIGALRNAVRAERQLIQAEKAAATAKATDVIPKKPANVVKTAAGRDVDISRGYNVRGPDGLKIPFNVDTPLEKAKAWTKNFYNPGEVEFQTGQSFGNRMALKQDAGSFIDYREKEGAIQITMSKVTQKGTGVGAGLYRKMFEHAQQKGSKVYSDRAMSQASVDVWQRFIDLGYPIQANPRKKMMSGGYEHATDPKQPLFMFDPSKIKNGTMEVQTKGVKDPVAEIDKNKPHLKVGNPVPKADEADQLIYNLRRQTGVPAEQREKILDVYNDYKMAETPEAKQELATQLKAMMPTEKAQ